MDKYQQQYQNECVVLSCLIKEPSLIQECKLDPKHFYGYNTKAIFTRLKELHKNGELINVVTLIQSSQEDLFRMGGTETIQMIADYSYSVHSFKSYETLVMQFNAVEYSLQLIDEYKEKTKDIHRVTDLNELIMNINAIDVSMNGREMTTLEQLQQRVHYHESTPADGLSGVDTGFLNTNKATDGWQIGDLIIIAARPSVGKTALAINMKTNAIQRELDTVGTFISAEMATEQIVDREIALLSGISIMKMRNPNKFFTPEDWKKYRKALVEYELISDRLNIKRDKNVRDIRTRVRRLKQDQPEKKHVIYIDHLSHLKIDGKYANRNLEVGAICQELKDIAVDYKVVIVLLCQLSRSVESQADKRPNLSHLRDSGEIEQIADVVAFIYREDYYNKNTDKPKTHITELLFEKNRQGSVGIVKLKFQEGSNRFIDYILEG